MIAVADATNLPLADKSVDLVMGSPPYDVARTYGLYKAAREFQAWAIWMVGVTEEALRVCKGPVLWVCAGTGNYCPGPEGLIWYMAARCHVFRPCIWTKNAPPTGKGWFSNDWEYVVGFAKKKPLPYWNPEAIGTPLKYKAGGHFRQRKQDGTRKRGSDYPTHKMRKRPSNVFHVTVGGGHLGSPLAHENEAPYPVKLVEPFILSLCRPGGIVLDPFSGSGTTASVALQHGRRFIATDIRPSQAELTRRRIKETQTCLHF